MRFYVIILVGIPVFSAVFTDDFKSRSLQTAIGRGMSRTKLIFTRFFEVVIILIEANVLLSIVVFINGEVFGVKGTAITDVLNSMWVDSTTIYIVLPLLITVRIFRRRELEF